MDVVLLGTGAADGWPNPFCACASCRDAAARGTLRGQSSALVDGTLLLDCGSGVPAQAVRLGHSLAGVRHVLVTHAHVDHLGPQALLFRSWTSAGPLDLVGPAAALDECRDWIGPDDPVRLVPVAAGDEIVLGGHRVRVLPARHRVFADGDAVLYDVTGPDGARLLWACDTGPWPDDWYAAVAGARYDAVLLEQTHGLRTDLGDGHLHLTTFADVLDRLREVGAVDAETLVRAVHLGHHNPPEPGLTSALAAVGAAPGHDGERLRLDHVRRSADAEAYGRDMANAPLVVVMGISGVGKSAVGHQVADLLGVDYADGDDYHPAENIAKMSAGTPLNDDDRWPWLRRVGEWLAERSGEGGVISCSALKRSYRDVLRDAAPDVLFLHLVGDHDLIADRMAHRDHFMPVSLLESQERTLEPLGDDERGWVYEITPTPEQIARHFLADAGLETSR